MAKQSQTFSIMNLLKVLLAVIVILFLFYLLAFNDVVVRFISLLLNGCLVVLAFLVYRKIDYMIKIKEERKEPIQNEKLPDETEMARKEQQLNKLELDKTQLLEELLTKAGIEEEEKQKYRAKIREKEDEASKLQQELAFMKGRIANLILKRDPEIERIVLLLDADFILNHSLVEINQRFQEISGSFSEQSIEHLKKANYIDQHLQFTRIGYRELLKTAKRIN
ncbi:hypothetical protein NSS70_08265 [Aeribacillus sp. FSL K6-2848]|uniref:hypothetical protein n=1 Tax=Aeribacillus sp. FSL K6-2848 TaxID=2954612 RepID=UPI0030FD07C3